MLTCYIRKSRFGGIGHGRPHLRCEVGIDRPTLPSRRQRHLVVEPHLVQRWLTFPYVG